MNISSIFKPSFIKKVFLDFLKNPGEGLYQRTVRSGVWVFSLRILERALGIVKLVILARILAPNDFGLMGIALLALACLETFSQTGFQQALIQKKGGTEKYLDVAWTFMLIRNLVIFAILFIGAPYIAEFFDAPKVTPIMRIIGISLLFGGPGGIGGFANIGVLYFQKELEFNKQFIYHLTGTLADFVVSVTTAIVLKSVWALVFGLLAGNIVRFFIGYRIHPYRPRLNFDFDKARELFGFGKWILWSNILVFLLNQGDDIFLGKLLGASALGLYQMAYRISNMPATEITHVITQVTFPAYSKLQDNLAGLRDAYLKTLKFTAFLSIPLALGIFILAPEFTRIFLGDKWMPMVPAMQALTVWGLIRSLDATTSSVWQALGKPKIPTIFQLAKLLILIMVIYPFTIRWGILGTALAIALESIIVHIWRFIFITKTLECSTYDLFKHFIGPYLASVGMMAIIIMVKYIVPQVHLLTFFSLVIVGIVSYILVLMILDAFLGNEYHEYIKKLVRRSFI